MFLKTYGTQIAIADTIFLQFFAARYKDFKGKKAKDKFEWAPEILDFYHGDARKFKRPWKDCDDIYFPMNISGNHWILCQISIGSQMITAYDSDQSIVVHKDFEKAMEPLANMLPYFFLKCGLFDHRIDFSIEPGQKLQPFDFGRPLSNVVLQCQNRYFDYFILLESCCTV